MATRQQTQAPGQIIFLNGIPNAGKTTLAAAVQGMLKEPYWHLSLDDFLRGFTDRHRLGQNPPPFTPLMYGYLRSLRQLAIGGIDIMAEAVLTPERLNTYLDLFGDLPVLLVGLHVSLEEAHRRERQRTDRLVPYEVTAHDFNWVHAHQLYDLELHMGRLTPVEAAEKVLDLVRLPPSPTAFQRLLAARPAYQGKSMESKSDHTEGRPHLFCLTGASGAGKSTIGERLQGQIPGCVVLEQDVLWGPEMDTPADNYRRFRSTWLRLVAAVQRSGQSVLLVGTAMPDQMESCPERAEIGDIHYLALVCDDDAVAERIAARGPGRDTSPAMIARMTEFNRWWREHAAELGIPTLNTSALGAEETAVQVRRWIEGHLIRTPRSGKAAPG